MKQKILLTLFAIGCITASQAQKKAARVTAYAITGAEKGSSRWAEVNLVDLATGEVVQQVYKSTGEVTRLNARTGKPIALSTADETTRTIIVNEGEKLPALAAPHSVQRFIINEVKAATPPTQATVATEPTRTTRRIIVRGSRVNKELPFATNSAACAYDKKRDRLYYTPMGINQLRYIDLDAKQPTVRYFEDEAFGKVTNTGDVHNQITRMVIASDGNGYALTNNAQSLIRFTTDRKAIITDLGVLTDHSGNGKFSVHSSSAYGGDMIADKSGNLYLLTANRRVYKISIKTMEAQYLGSIKGLPDGYTTNGAVVEAGSKIIVSSSHSTAAYYRVDMESLQAEPIPAQAGVFNASDLANATLLDIKKKKEEKLPEEEKEEILAKEEVLNKAAQQTIRSDESRAPSLNVYPNPVTNSIARLSFAEYKAGRYEAQLTDLGGKLVSKQALQVSGKNQVLEFRLPSGIAKGTYFVRVLDASNQMINTEKISVQ